MAADPRPSSRPGAPASAGGREPVAIIAGFSWLLWAGISIPIVLEARSNEAEALVLLGFIVVIPLALLAGLTELVIAWRRLPTALAVVAVATGSPGILLGATLVSGSVRAPEGSGIKQAFLVIGLSLAIVGAGQVLLAGWLLRGRWRLIPLGVAIAPLVAVGAAIAWPASPASCPAPLTADLPGRLVMIGLGIAGTDPYAPPGSICVATPRAGRAVLVFSPTADDVASGREWLDHPVFSPDGRSLAFTWEDRVAVIRDDGSDLTLVGPDGRWLEQPSWSPDGSMLAVVAGDPRHRVAATVGIADGIVHDVVDIDEPLNSRASPAWSPIANEILLAIAGSPPAGADLVRLLPDGTMTQLAHGLDPDWSPDGRRIAFVARRLGADGMVEGNRVLVMEADGRSTRELGGPPGEQRGPVWSPDGAWIAYSGFDGAWALYVQPAAGGPATRLASGLQSPSIDWAP